MKNFFNTFIYILAFLALFSIFVSSWVHYQPSNKITGLVVGTVNVTINRTVAIILIRDNINFTVSNPGNNRVSYTATDLTGAPLSNCGARNNTQTCGFNLTNDGSVTVNITMRETGTLFSSSAFNRIKHFLYNVSVPNTARTICPSFYTTPQPQIGYANPLTGVYYGIPTGNWSPVNTTVVTIICGLNFTNADSGNIGSDLATIDVNITVPSDEVSGNKGATLEILGVFAGYD